MKSQINLNVDSLGNGAVKEKLAQALTEIAENIMDPNTDATKVRKLTLNMSFKPDDKREVIATAIDVKNSLAPQEGVSVTLMIGQTGSETVMNELKSGAKGQTFFDPDDAQLKNDDGTPIEDDQDSNRIDFNAAKKAKEAN